MQTLTSTLLVLTLLLCGCYAGMSLLSQIGILPAMRRLRPSTYADAFGAMDFYLDRSMPPYKLSLLVVTLALCICLLLQHRTALALAAGSSFLLSLMALIVTVAKQLPLNRQLKNLPEGTPDDVLIGIREASVRNFMARCIMAVLSFAILCFGVVFL